MTLYAPSNPEEEEITLTISDENVRLTRFTHYSFNSHWLTPTDAFTFGLAGEDLPPDIRSALKLGARVRLSINRMILADGHIDSVDVRADRTSGVTYEISGRDRLAMAVDSVMNPTKSFKEGMTLADAMKFLFAEFGWKTDGAFVIDNAANRNLQTGGTRGVKLSHSKKHPGTPLKDRLLHQLKPHNHEGVFAFASRICQRFGVWIWCSCDGEKLIIGKPDFNQPPLYQLRRNATGGTNVLSASAHFSVADQPTVIIADGFCGIPEFGKTRAKSICVNPYFGVDDKGFLLPEVSAILLQHENTAPITMVTQPFPHRDIRMPLRPMYLHDDESKTQLQLDNFVRREMSLLMRKSLTYHATVSGHGQGTGSDFIPWIPDTTVDIEDDVAGIHERMWILSRTFTKSRSGGTKTDLELIRLHSIQFDEQATEEAKDAGQAKPQPTPPKSNDPVVRRAAINTVDKATR